MLSAATIDEYRITFLPEDGRLPYNLRVMLDEVRGARFQWWVAANGITGC